MQHYIDHPPDFLNHLASGGLVERLNDKQRNFLLKAAHQHGLSLQIYQDANQKSYHYIGQVRGGRLVRGVSGRFPRKKLARHALLRYMLKMALDNRWTL
jgi:hypothetical protein